MEIAEETKQDDAVLCIAVAEVCFFCESQTLNLSLQKKQLSERDEVGRVVADFRGHSPISFGVVRILRYLGSSPRRLLQYHQYYYASFLAFPLFISD